jgi:hypothetical protein
MEAINRMVADSLARHGFEPRPVLHPIHWSRWFRCESSFSLLLVPSAPGIYALAEELLPRDEAAGTKRMLAVFDVAETEDLCVALSRQFAPQNLLRARLASGRCFVRFAHIADGEQRRSSCDALQRWLLGSSEAATGLAANQIMKDFGASPEETPQPAADNPGLHAESPKPRDEKTETETEN